MKGREQALKTWLDRDEAAQAIRQLNEEDLLFLNARIVERLKLIEQAQSTVELARFSIGDRVQFVGPGSRVVKGVVFKLNKKTAGVQSDDGRQWKVSPSLLNPQSAAKGEHRD